MWPESELAADPRAPLLGAESDMSFIVWRCLSHYLIDIGAQQKCEQRRRCRKVLLRGNCKAKHLAEPARDVVFRQLLLRVGENQIRGSDLDQIAQVEIS